MATETTSPPASPATTLPPETVRLALRLSVIEGALANVHITVSLGIVLTGFALLLGAGPFELGLIGALPFVAQLSGFVGAYLEERLGSRRLLATRSAALGRGLWLPIAFLPFLPIAREAQLALFLGLVAVFQALSGITGNTWVSWMSDIVPPSQRGRYFGFRNTVAGVVAMVVNYSAGQALDLFKARGQDAIGYALVLVVATVFGLAACLVMRIQPEPPRPRAARVNLPSLFGAPLRHGSFRKLILANLGWALVTGISSPFFNAYGLQTLQLSYATLALTAIVTSAVSLLTQPVIGRLQDRYGDRAVLLFCVLGVVPLPWGWVVSTPDNIVPLWLTSIGSGIFWPGILQGQMNLLMARAPAEGRGAFVATYGAIVGAGTFAAGLLGGALSSVLLATRVELAGVVVVGYGFLFVASSAGRLAMAGVFARLV